MTLEFPITWQIHGTNGIFMHQKPSKCRKIYIPDTVHGSYGYGFLDLTKMSGFSPKICTKLNLENLGGNLCRYFISKNFKAQSWVITFKMFLRFGRATVSEMLEKRLLVRNHCANLTESWLRTDHLMDIWLCGFIFFKSSPLSLGFHDTLWLWGAYFSNGWKPSPGTWFISVVARISCKCRRLAEPDAFSIRGFSEKPAPPVAELRHPIKPKGTSG